MVYFVLKEIVPSRYTRKSKFVTPLMYGRIIESQEVTYRTWLGIFIMCHNLLESQVNDKNSRDP